MNSITILGRFTDNPESKTTNDGKVIAHFTLADNRGQDQASFFRCTAFGKQAEMILNSCQKGHRFGVCGRMEEQAWTDNQGQQRRNWQVAVSQIEFIEPKQQQSAPPAAPAAAPTYGTGAPPVPPTGYGAPPAAPGGYAAPPYGAPAVPGVPTAPPAAPAAAPQPQPQQYMTDANGNVWQNGPNGWQVVKPAAAPNAPASAVPF
ncbi:MAG: single-stranded DNA-binding protein [Sporomusaceae bacterium]|nr:single-stranded DNA-binding protein [Sporomusaceae bacterium]